MKVLALVFGVVLFAFVGVSSADTAKAKAKHNHHSLHGKLGDKIKKDGTHEVHKNGDHTVHAEVKGGKIVAVHVKHKTKGDVKVIKYKSSKNMVSAVDVGPAEEIPAQSDPIVSIGFGFVVDDTTQSQEIYWTPASVVADVSGAVDYVGNP
jgi:hypothetical protein